MKNPSHGTTAGLGRFLQEAREVFHMGSDVDDNPVSQAARSSAMLRANRFLSLRPQNPSCQQPEKHHPEGRLTAEVMWDRKRKPPSWFWLKPFLVQTRG